MNAFKNQSVLTKSRASLGKCIVSFVWKWRSLVNLSTISMQEEVYA